MNLFVVLLFACLGQTVRSYQCVAGIKSYFEELDVSGGVFTKEKVTLDCKENKIIKIWTVPVKPTSRHGTDFHGIGRDTNETSLKIMPVRRLWFRCENSMKRREESAKFVYGQNTLPEVKKVCPTNMKALITALDPMKYDYDRYNNTQDFNQDGCIGKRECVIEKGTKMSKATYKIETDCRAENHALHCCNSEESKDSEMFQAKRACNLELECECCQRKTDDIVNIRSCKSMGNKWAKVGAHLAGIHYDMGVTYDESDDDDATDTDPDFDEDGCHVRKAYLKFGGGERKPICIPGNMARILSLVDLFSDQHGGKCVVRSIKNDAECTGEVDPDEQYYFGVNVLLPPESGVVSNFKNALTARLEEENIETPFLLKDNIQEVIRTIDLNDVEMIKFTLAFSL